MTNIDNHAVYAHIDRPDPKALLPFAEVGVSDVLEALEISHLLDGAIRPVWNGAQIIGPAVTALNMPGDTLMMHYALELCKPGDVLVVSCAGHNPSATWGKIVTVAGQAKGIAGAIIDGAVRDTTSIREVKFPVWSRSIDPRGSTRKGPGSINVPILCGGVTVNPGDLVMADDDGIIVFPASRMAELLAAAQKRVAREESIMSQLEQGVTPFALLGMQPAVENAGLMAKAEKYHPTNHEG